jgi:general secretion pathway protein G
MNPKAKTAHKAMSRAQLGMTLIEIMVVIAIIGIVSGAIGYGVTRYFGQAKIDACKAQINNISNHLEMFLYEHDDYPSSLTDLTKKEPGRGKAILKKSQLKDPWKKKLNYSTQSDGFKLCSSGPDKKNGGKDDICYGDDDDK